MSGPNLTTHIKIKSAFPFSRRGRRRYMSTKCWSMLEEVPHFALAALSRD